MSEYQSIKLKKGREISVKAGHPWVFSNAILESERIEAGSVVSVYSADNEFIGIGTYNPRNSISVRFLTNKKEEINEDFFAKKLKELMESKKKYLPAKTTGFRLAHADADKLPGLILDVYDDVFVFQISTIGMEKFRDEIINAISKNFKPKAIVERSDIEIRKQEGLAVLPVTTHEGKVDGFVEFLENGFKFYADVIDGQKTGFFLDQRDARMNVGKLSEGKKVLNLFGYSGAFSVYALAGKAEEVTTVDISGKALEIAKKNLEANKFDTKKNELVKMDAFDFLNKCRDKNEKFDLIVSDPPAFSKSGENLPQALKAYSRLNKSCFELLNKGGILVASSCSGRVTLDDFLNSIKISAGQANKDARILSILGQAFDHTVKLSFPEGRYLKTVVVEVL
ncbi:MAG: class I SAM-dependent rRNA methyltransferase [Candidatus Gracilibacteria bacterium]|jgi:23S rRNA (cytosine1962-C5)-methyltransferase